MSKNYNLSRNDVAKMLKCCKMHVSNLVRRGELHPIDISTPGSWYKRLRFCSDDIISFINRRKKIKSRQTSNE